MPLASTQAMVRAARAGRYAVGAFEPYGPDQILATVAAAEDERAPVILQFWSEVIETWGVGTLMAVAREAARRARVPVAVHLDHCTDEALIEECLEAGLSSVMFDGSRLPLEENVARTRAVVRRAHAAGADVEAELGIIGALADYASPEEAMEAARELLTTPEQAAAFVRETGVDILAPAVGSVHGCPFPMARLDIARIAAIAEATGVPLALHGGSGIPPAQVEAAIAAGIAKVNVDAEVRGAYIAALRESVEAIGRGTNDWEDLARWPRAAREATRRAVRARIGSTGSAGRAGQGAAARV
ncbi:MAG: class II fructose-bisphosphate aldolase [Chthonomonadales bacterium]|nr:class II fructose-bisphosphate aldolase [Chthonomonadales bacterium]